MPFPVDKKYIEEMEEKLNVKFPKKYIDRMMKDNGGEIFNKDFYFELYPFFDKTDKKRISRTCNHIEKETLSIIEAKIGFPENAIAIGSDEGGNKLILIYDQNKILGEELFFWRKGINQVEKIANDINEFEK